MNYDVKSHLLNLTVTMAKPHIF